MSTATEQALTLFEHVTDGGAVYLTDNHRFSAARVIIRLDGGAELLRCDVTAPDTFGTETAPPAHWAERDDASSNERVVL